MDSIINTLGFTLTLAAAIVAGDTVTIRGISRVVSRVEDIGGGEICIDFVDGDVGLLVDARRRLRTA